MPPEEDRAFYYTELDVMVWAEKVYGPDFVKFLKKIRMYGHPVPPRGVVRCRTDARWRFRGAGMVGPRVARQPAGGYVSENRPIPQGSGRGLREGMGGVEEKSVR